MNEVKKYFYQTAAKQMVEILNEHQYDAHYAEDIAEAKQMVLEMIPEGSSISVGGSVTLADMDMPEVFRQGNYKFFERYIQPDFASMVEVYRQGLLADVFVSSANAVTRNGEIVCLDCSANRAASMIFGPKKVILIMGANKIVDTLEEGMKRAKKVAPLNAKRLGHKTPCAVTGVCEDCQCDARLCNAYGILNTGLKFKGRISVIMIGDQAGY